MTPDALFDLSGKVAVITGGAGGIGTIYGRALAEVGAAVVLADVNAEAAQRAAEELASSGGASAIGVAVDVTRAESTQAMAAAATEAFGGIDILINNAAIMTDLPRFGLADMPTAEWDRVINVNLRGPAALHASSRAVHDRARRRSHHQRLSAGAFTRGGIYGVSKYALHGLTANLASELGGRGINVNAIAPGLVENDSGYVSLPKDSPFRSALEAQIPGQKSGPPDDLIGTLLLLCSKAGSWINGQTISVDGGWVMRL